VAVTEAGVDLGDEEAEETASEGEGRDAREDVTATEWVVVDFSAPADVGFEGDFDTFVAHGFLTGVEDFLVEGMKHVYAEVEPVGCVRS